MGRLDKFKKEPNPARTVSIGTRLPKELHDKMLDKCKYLGLTTAYALYLLCDEEFGPWVIGSGKTQTEDDKVEIVNESVQYDEMDPSNVFVRRAYQIDNRIPCPLCEGEPADRWANYSKYAEHVRDKHEGNTPDDIYRNNIQEVIFIFNEMAKERGIPLKRYNHFN